MNGANEGKGISKALIFGLVAVIVVLGAALIVMAIGRAGTLTETAEVDVLANSDNECVVCHRKTTPGIYPGVITAAAGWNVSPTGHSTRSYSQARHAGNSAVGHSHGSRSRRAGSGCERDRADLRA